MSAKRDPHATRSHILHAADVVICQHGVAAAGLNAIIAKSKQSKGSVFHHFRDKNHLILTWLTEVLHKKLTLTWLTPLAESTAPIETIKKIFQALPENEYAFTALSLNHQHTELIVAQQNIIATWHAALANALRDGQKNGQVHPQVKADDEAHFMIHLALGKEHAAKNAAAGFERSLSAYLDTLRPI